VLRFVEVERAHKLTRAARIVATALLAA